MPRRCSNRCGLLDMAKLTLADLSLSPNILAGTPQQGRKEGADMTSEAESRMPDSVPCVTSPPFLYVKWRASVQTTGRIAAARLDLCMSRPVRTGVAGLSCGGWAARFVGSGSPRVLWLAAKVEDKPKVRHDRASLNSDIPRLSQNLLLFQ